MIYILFALIFSLFIFSPVKFYLLFNKDDSDEHIEISIVYLKIIKINFKIPEMIFYIRNFIPFVAFEVNLSSNKLNKYKNKKNVILPLKLKMAMLVNFIKELFQQIKRFKYAARLFLRTVKLINIHIDIKFGMENPAISGIIAGGIWSFIYFVLSMMSYYLDFKKTSASIKVITDYEKSKSIQILFTGIFEVRIAHIIIAGLFFSAIWMFSRRSNIKLRRAKEYGWSSH